MPKSRGIRVFARCLLAIILFSLSGMSVMAAGEETPVPLVGLSGSNSALIGESTTFYATFDNTSSDLNAVGYGPFIDIVLPTNGADGVAGTDIADGLSFVSATYETTTLDPVVIVFDEIGQAEHPLTGEIISGTPGDELVVFELPFGSFVPDQPSVRIAIRALLSEFADLDTTLYVTSRAGFYLGADPLNNPSTDAPIISAWSDPGFAMSPTIMTIHKDYIGPEDETATGPNWVRQYEIRVNIADGQPVSNITLSDILPPELAYVSLDSVSPADYTLTAEPPLAVPSESPTSTLSLTWEVITGTGSSADITARFSFFVPEYDAYGDPILDPLTGGCTTISNQATASGTWTPIDERDEEVVLSQQSAEHEADFEACALVIQKDVSIVNDLFTSGATPGDTLGYTLHIQASDYYTVGGDVSFVVTDTLSDGQLFAFDSLSGADASYSIGDRDGTATGVFTDGINLDVDTSLNPLYGTSGVCGGGETILTFDLGTALAASLTQPDALLTGGSIGQSGDPSQDPAYPAPCAPAQGTITYRTVIQEQYGCTVPSGDQSIDQNDYLDNDVDIVGGVYTGDPLTLTGTTGDDSAERVDLVDGSISKVVYARNGVIGDTGPFEAGDTITYRIRYNLPTADVEDLSLIDFLPLPTLQVNDWDADNTTGDAATWMFDEVVAIDSVPVSGHASYGPADTFHEMSGGNPSPAPAPVLTADASGNSLTFYYGNHDIDNGISATIDLLFTVTVQDDPFADGMYLTNQLQAIEQNSFLDVVTTTDIVQIQLTGPELNIYKGIVWASNGELSPATAAPVAMDVEACPAFSEAITSAGLETNPIDSDLSGVDGGDTIRFAIVLENTGTGPSGAFDVQLSDALPTGITSADVQNICVTDGAGTPLAYTELGSGLFDLAGGIELTDGAETGAIGPYSEDAGTNIVVVTYDVVVPASAAVDSLYENTASLANYTNVEGGEDYIDKYGVVEETASWETTDPTVSKSLLSTSESQTSGNNAVIGELVTYQVQIDLPEGTTPDAVLVDTLEAGLAFVDVITVTAPVSITTDYAGSWDGVVAGSSLDNVGTGDANVDRQLTLSLGSLVNSDTDDETTESVTVEYRAVVLNTLANVRGVSRENSAVLQWTTGSDTAGAVSVVVVEPQFTISKDMTPSTADAGDQVVITLTIANPSASSQVDAYDVSLEDMLSTGLTFVGFGAQTGLTPDSLTETDGQIDATWSVFPLNQTATVVFTATMDADVSAGQIIQNGATVEWASKADASTAGANPLGVRRTGDTSDVGALANDYLTTAADTTSVPVAIAKTLISTSESETTGTYVAVGEIARYRLVATIPEGETASLVIQDRIPTGLGYLDDGTATAAIISDDAMTSTLAGSLELTSIYTTGSSVVTPVVVLPDTMASSSLSDTAADTYSSGSDVYFHFGTVTNDDRDENAEYIVIEFNAQVLNTSTAQEGVSLSNNARIYTGSTVVATSGSVAVRVAEPVLTVNKQIITAAPYDAADELVYEVVVTNSSTAGNGRIAHEVVISDTIDADTTLVSAVMSNGNPVSDMGAYVQSSVDSLAPGESVTLTVTVDISDAVAPATAVADTATASWTSLPASGTTSNPTGSVVLGSQGAANGERDGSGGVNDHITNDSVSVSVDNVAPTKVLLGTSEDDTSGTNVAIGELATFEIEVVIPEGATSVMTITDAIPNGLWVDLSTVQLNFGTSVTAVSSDVSGGGSSGADLVVALTDLVVEANNVADDNLLTITYTAHVVDESGVSGITVPTQTVLSNGVSVQVGSSPVVNATPVSLRVVEPRIQIVKEMSPDPIALDDTLVMTVTVRNTGLASAYDLAVSDQVPGTYVENLTLTNVSAGASPSTSVVGDDLLVTLTQDTLVAGAEMSFVVTGTVKAGVPYQTVITNSATVTQATTLPGDDPLERTEPEVSDAENVTVGRPDIVVTKTDNVTTAAPGDTLNYVITVRNAGNVRATGIVVTDTLPALASYVVDSASDGGVYDADARQLNWTVALLAPGGSVNLTYSALMDAYVSEFAESITNTVSAADDGVRGEDPNPDDNHDTDIDTINATAVAEVTKEALTESPVAPGDPVSYSVEVTNTGDREAEMVLVDALDDVDLSLVVGTVATTQGTVVLGNTPGDTTVRVELGTVAPADIITVTFDGLTADPITKAVAQVENQSTVSGNSITTVDSDDPTTPAADDPTIVPVNALAQVESTKADLLLLDGNSDGIVNPGDTLRYTVIISSTGNMPANGVIFSDTPDSNTALVVGSVTTTQGSVTMGNNAGNSTVSVALGQLPAGSTATITFDVIVDNPLPASIESVANQGLVSGDNITPVSTDDPDTPDEGDETVTPVVTTHTLVSTKTVALLTDSDSDAQVSPGDVLEYTVVVTNTGDIAVTSLVISDVLDSNLALVVGSVATTQGTVTTGNTLGDTDIEVTLDELAGGNAFATVTFAATIVNPLPEGVDTVINQALVQSNEVADVLTDDPTTDTPDDPNVTPVTAAPEIMVTKDDGVSLDDTLVPGDVFTYTLTVENVGNQDIALVLDDDIEDTNLSLVAGTVTTTRGTVLLGNSSDDAVQVDLGTMSPSTGIITVTFQVQVNDPIVGGVDSVANQALVSGEGVEESSNDPETLAEDDPTVTYVDAAPAVDMLKSAALLNDVDTNGVVSPGDVLRYTLLTENSGNASAMNLTLEDTPDANSTLITGTVTTTQGTVTTGNGAGDVTVAVSVPELMGSESFTVTYDVMVNYAFTEAITLTNQALIDFDETTEPIPSDDPGTPEEDDPTLVPVDITPALMLTKTDSLLLDENEDAALNPGETLVYTIVLTNKGFQPASAVVLTDTIDSGAVLVTGTVTSTLGTVVEGNGAEDTAVRVELDTLEAQAVVTVSFQVTLPLDWPLDVTEIANQTVLTSAETEPLVSDDPETDEADDPTVTPIVAQPDVLAFKVDELLDDVAQDGAISAGDALRYTITLNNVGTGPASSVVLSDTLDTNTSLIAGSVTTTQGMINIGNGQADTAVQVTIDELLPGTVVTVTYDARIASELAPGTVLSNQAVISSPDFLTKYSDDPAAGGDEDPTETPVVPPTAIDLLSFGITGVHGSQVDLAWTTATEVDNQRFEIWRADSSSFSEATQVGTVMAQAGAVNGASYAWSDTDVPDGAWWYWLVDVDSEGASQVHYDRVRLAVVGRQFYLPLLFN